jgi:D-glycero-D-manno-heptose 1,7-bisphosphate phosphatase
MAKKRAVFLDRDGVIVEQTEGYVNRPEDLVFVPRAAEAIARLNACGLPVVVATNQAGVAKGFLTLATLDAIHDRLREQLAARGARLDAIYACPHVPEATIPEFAHDCDCRKPGTGMLDQAARELGLDLEISYLVGDMTADLLAGKRAGCRTILVKTGFGGSDGRYEVEPDLVAPDLFAAVDLILAEVAACKA